MELVLKESSIYEDNLFFKVDIVVLVMWVMWYMICCIWFILYVLWIIEKRWGVIIVIVNNFFDIRINEYLYRMKWRKIFIYCIKIK